ncbi:peptidylprolyl isomerase [Candidatus Woesearchaeota archaeon]|nr:peptidylprolyl isomerase [Candidatus Woesearchaeota archaeon]MBT6519474.1 peptidylprolyl isomerase [Candidatus Woesearchaeota archaeon]MBT7368222.1 peptidylprolyl isomerase [Candidatus Woesearchaeota archaeon]
MMAVKVGDKVKVHYKGTLDNGEVFDSSEGKDPLEFEVGAGQVIKGFEEGLVGMEPGDKKELKIPPEKAYGNRMDKLIQKVPKDMVPENVELKEGAVLTLQAPTGQVIPAKVVSFTDAEVTLDLNHPLAEKTLIFNVELVEVVA